MGRKNENTGFCCIHCGRSVRPLTNGSYRNHCPFCLHSVHVDLKPGDRLNSCRGLMEPVGLRNWKKGWQIEFRCRRCGAMGVNLIAEGTDQSDDIDAVLKLMRPGCRDR